MTESYKPKVAEHKLRKATQLAKLIETYPIIGVVNVENIPAPQLQKMRQQLRSSVHFSMAKKRIIKIAVDEAEKSKQHVSELKKHLIGMPAMIFTNENPFKLASMMRKSKSSAPAKPGQTAPRDITIPAGATQFSPGPIISELSAIGLKTGVESGKVTIRQDHTAAMEGEKISRKVAEVLAKLGIQPMEIGLDLVAIYENGNIYAKDILSVDEQQYIDNLKHAAAEAHNLAVYIAYPAKETIKQLIMKAYNEAKGLALSKELISDVYAHKLVVDAERQAAAVKSHLPEDFLKSEKEEAKHEQPKQAAQETKPPAERKPAEEKKEKPKEPETSEEEKEIDLQIEQIIHEKEMEKIREVEAIAKEVLTKGKSEPKGEETEFFEEVRRKMETDKQIAEKLGHIKETQEETTGQKESERLFEELKKKGTLRQKDEKAKK